MSVADMVAHRAHEGAARHPADPRADTKRFTKTTIRLLSTMLVEINRDARRLGLSQAEWWRVAALAWLKRDGEHSGTAALLDEVQQAITAPSLASIVARHSKPHRNAKIDMAERKTAADAANTARASGGKARFVEGKR